MLFLSNSYPLETLKLSNKSMDKFAIQISLIHGNSSTAKGQCCEFNLLNFITPEKWRHHKVHCTALDRISQQASSSVSYHNSLVSLSLKSSINIRILIIFVVTNK